MAPDIITDGNTWTDIYAGSGIAPKKPLMVQNKGTTHILLWQGTIPPSSSSRDGASITPMGWATLDAGFDHCWVGNFSGTRGRLFVQEVTE